MATTWEKYEEQRGAKAIKRRIQSGMAMEDLRVGDRVWIVFIIARTQDLQRWPGVVEQKLEKKVWIKFRRGDTYYMGKYYPRQLEKRTGRA